MDVKSLFKQAFALHKNGQLRKALEEYQHLLRTHPNDPQLLHWTGVLFYQMGQFERAIELLNRSLQISPSPDAHNHLGNVHLETKSIAQAIQHYQMAVSLDPDYLDAHFNLAIAYESSGCLNQAVQEYLRCIELQGEFVGAFNNLSNLYYSQKLYSQALEVLEKGLKIENDNPLLLNSYARVLKALGQYPEALEFYQLALKQDPGRVEVLLNMGHLFLQMGQYNLAEDCFKQGMSINPNYAQIYVGLGIISQSRLKYCQAIAFYQKAVELEPSSGDAHIDLAQIYSLRGQIKKAIEHFQLYFQYGTSRVDKHESLAVQSSYLICQYSNPELSNKEVFRLFQKWGEQFHKLDESKHKLNTSYPLNIGFVSGDFKKHSASGSFIKLFKSLNPKKFTKICFSDVKQPDSITEYIRTLADDWHDITSLDNPGVVERIKQAKIDILLDLSGHTIPNRLPVFALKPAPIQISGLGFGVTTGLKQMDYLFSDESTIPVRSIAFQSEKIVYLPSQIQWEVPEIKLKPLEPPFLNNSYLIFGSANRLFKLNAQVLTLWGMLLKCIPNSVLHIKSNDLSTAENKEWYRQYLCQFFDSPERIILSSDSERIAYLNFYNQIDIALDPFPYNGGITTCEALWMGVPVMTLNSREGVTESLLKQVGLVEWISSSKQHYIDFLVNFSQDKALGESLNAYRQSLRKKIEEAPVSHPSLLAHEIEKFFHSLL